MRSMSIALGLYSVYREFQSDIERTRARVRELGFEGVEFYGEFVHPPERIKSLLDRYGLVNCGWHTEWRLLQADTLSDTLAYHVKAGTPNVIIPALGGPWEIGHSQREDSPEIWIRHAKEMNALSNRLSEHGLRLGYHTHAHEFETRFGSVTPWDLLCEHTDHGIILELDTGNCLEAGVDSAQILSTVTGRSELVHCKPYSRRNGLETHIGADDDDNQWPDILQQCESAGTQWLIVEHESEVAFPSFVGAERCLEGIRGFLNRKSEAKA
jgi:sugar phosphate isomerase/epimerase